MKKPSHSTAGFSLAQVLVATALVAGLGYTVAQISNTANQASQKTHDSLGMAAIRAQLTAINQDQQTWLSGMRSMANVSSCLPVSGTTYSCPVNEFSTITDAYAKSLVPTGGAISGQSLLALSGQQIAGTPAAPQYYDLNGIPLSATVCPANTTNAQCRFMATGYWIRSASTPTADPGYVTFLARIEVNPRITAKGPPTAAAFEALPIGIVWKQSPPPCSSGYIGNDTSTPPKKICYQVRACPTGTQFGGWTLGTVATLGVASMLCPTMPANPYAGTSCNTVAGAGPGTAVTGLLGASPYLTCR